MPIRQEHVYGRHLVRLPRTMSTIFCCTLFVLAFYLFIQIQYPEISPNVRSSAFTNVKKGITDSVDRHYVKLCGGTTKEHFVPKYTQPTCDSPDENRTSLADILRNSSPGPREICRCNGSYTFDGGTATGNFAHSTCSIEATLRGSNQSVISFVLFLTPETNLSQLLEGVKMNLNLLREIYPGWLMRVYTDVNFTQQLCALVCSSEDIFFCDVKHLPGIEEATMTSILSSTWRFLPLGDPSVGKFLVRDLDSVISRREKAAVDEWLESGYPFHVMRDHPSQDTYIMAGMWGADNAKMCWKTAKELQRKFLMTKKEDFKTVGDQELLRRLIYTAHSNDILSHDSYFCEKYPNAIPFPTRRLPAMNFVGASFQDPAKLFRCPKACRPSYGSNWLIC